MFQQRLYLVGEQKCVVYHWISPVFSEQMMFVARVLNPSAFCHQKAIHTSYSIYFTKKLFLYTMKAIFCAITLTDFFILTNIIWYISSFKIKSLLFSALRSNTFTVCMRVSTLTDNVAYLSPSENRRWRIGSDKTGEEDKGRQTDSLLKDSWSSATLKILSSMPSRTIGQYWLNKFATRGVF